jgi:thiamine biosynthesis lipoprotein
MRSSWPPVKRAKPLLGTLVSIAVEGLSPDVANSAVTQCFDRIAHIHRRMSFQDPHSDVSRLNREAHCNSVQVDRDTYEVLRLAADISAHSGGTFDVTVSPSLSTAWRLREPSRFAVPDENARWSDIELLPRCHVRFARPLVIDLSGIAKGYAVDRALALLSDYEPPQTCVNAGGDLGLCGSEAAQVRLDVPLDGRVTLPVIEVKNGCLASSGPRDDAAATAELEFVDGAARRRVAPRFVSVLASTCAVADALTKVVMALGLHSSAVLRHYAARALLAEQPEGWREVA